ncbi:MAG: hypothetical protein ACFFBD_30060, partial [Candidatus Hodarchaeota archaeon]
MRVLPDPELTPEELRQLQELRETHKIKSVRRRAQVILNLNLGLGSKYYTEFFLLLTLFVKAFLPEDNLLP